MEPTRLEQQLKAEKVHYDELCRIEPFLKRGATIDNNTLRSLGVVKSAPLDVDNPILQASHQGTAATTTTTTFFLPCVPHDTRYPDLDHTDKWPGFWEETMDRNKATDPEWVQSARERYPQFRASFFTRSLWRILDLVLDEQYLEPEDEQVQKARTLVYLNPLPLPCLPPPFCLLFPYHKLINPWTPLLSVTDGVRLYFLSPRRMTSICQSGSMPAVTIDLMPSISPETERNPI